MRFFEKLVVAYFFGPPCMQHSWMCWQHTDSTSEVRPHSRRDISRVLFHKLGRFDTATSLNEVHAARHRFFRLPEVTHATETRGKIPLGEEFRKTDRKITVVGAMKMREGVEKMSGTEIKSIDWKMQKWKKTGEILLFMVVFCCLYRFIPRMYLPRVYRTVLPGIRIISFNQSIKLTIL